MNSGNKAASKKTRPKSAKTGTKLGERQKKQLMAIAYHEAGHAVMYKVCKCRFRYVTIEPDGDSLGHLRRFRRTHKDGWIHIHALFCSLAGPAAEKRYTGRWNNSGAHSDYYQALDYARGADGTGSGYYENDPLPQYLQKGALKQVQRSVDAWWPAIHAVATELLAKTRLTEKEVINICESQEVVDDQRILWMKRMEQEQEEQKREVQEYLERERKKEAAREKRKKTRKISSKKS